jgi:putative spermidine/putrescine transport system substrate-binding protein
MKTPITRRTFVGGVAGAAGVAAFGGPGFAQLALPTSPVALSVIDVAGNLALTQKAIENYRKAKPNLVSRITFTKAPAPELAGKIKAQQDAGRVDIDLVLTGTDALSAGIEQKLWVDLIAGHAGQLPKLDDIYLPAAAKMQTLAKGQGVVVTYYPSGPLLEYMPDKVKNVPTTAEELLAWTKANPNRLIYARPANSGPGRTFMMGLPYILGDKDPKDPAKGWDKTWAYLKELGQNIEYYPAGTGAVMKELGEGSRDMTVSTTGWDINPRVLGVGAEGGEGGGAQGLPLGRRRPLHVRAERPVQREARRPSRPHELPAHQGAAGLHLRRGLFLSGSRREGRDPRHGSA